MSSNDGRRGKRRGALWMGLAVALVATVYVVIQIAGRPSTEPSSAPSAPVSRAINPLLDVSSEDRTKGNPDARVTLIEYSDFQCPACGSYYPMVKRLAADFGDQMRFVYRHFPLAQIHPHAKLAAQAAEAAGTQGKFWEMHDLIFEGQTTWTELDDARPRFMEYAKQIGLEMDRFKTDLDSAAIVATVQRHYQGAVLLRLPGTPTFFLNGIELKNPQSYGEFQSIVRQAINAS